MEHRRVAMPSSAFRPLSILIASWIIPRIVCNSTKNRGLGLAPYLELPDACMNFKRRGIVKEMIDKIWPPCEETSRDL
ncbi:hypothetical protein BGW80DRAFT_1312051 [Lactifluus volemus]|nr:hypothetical protein BGW80DRAFT_1312051 [Lactifluus volemus]